MAKRVTPEEIVEMHRLYARLGNYAAVGRELGRSGSTVAKYVQMNGVPQNMRIALNNLMQNAQSVEVVIFMKLNCVNIATTKVLEMSGFYSLILDKPYVERNSDRYEILVENCCIVITSSKIKTPVNPDCCGLEFIVDDVDAEYNRLINAGININHTPQTLSWNYRYFAVTDPDGNNIDFVQFVGDK